VTRGGQGRDEGTGQLGTQEKGGEGKEGEGRERREEKGRGWEEGGAGDLPVKLRPPSAPPASLLHPSSSLCPLPVPPLHLLLLPLQVTVSHESLPLIRPRGNRGAGADQRGGGRRAAEHGRGGAEARFWVRGAVGGEDAGRATEEGLRRWGALLAPVLARDEGGARHSPGRQFLRDSRRLLAVAWGLLESPRSSPLEGRVRIARRGSSNIRRSSLEELRRSATLDQRSQYSTRAVGWGPTAIWPRGRERHVVKSGDGFCRFLVVFWSTACDCDCDCDCGHRISVRV